MRLWSPAKCRTNLKILITLITLTSRTILPAFPIISKSWPEWWWWWPCGWLSRYHTCNPPITRSNMKGIIAKKSTKFMGCLKNLHFLGEHMNLTRYSIRKNKTITFSENKTKSNQNLKALTSSKSWKRCLLVKARSWSPVNLLLILKSTRRH